MKIVREGYPFIAISLGLSVAGLFIHLTVVLFFFGLTLFVVYFFRNPERRAVADPASIISPADGKIIFSGLVEEKKFLKEQVHKLSIFMSPMDVHVNRMPVTGWVSELAYNKGQFLTAFHDKASSLNEQNAVVIKNEAGEKILFVQIAGWLARRIVCYLKPGELWKQGDIFGLIRFGSRMDVYFPLSYDVCVVMGQKVKGGETLLARKEHP